MPGLKKSLALVMLFALIVPAARAELSSKAKKAEKLAAAGKVEDAKQIYKELMEKDPAREPALVKEGREGMAALTLSQAKLTLDAGDFAAARDKAQAVLNEFHDTPSAGPAAKLMVAAQLQLSQDLIEAKKYGDVIAQAKDMKKLLAGNESLGAEIDKMLSKLSADLLAAGEEGVALGKYEAAQRLLDFAWSASVSLADTARCRYAQAKGLRLSGQSDKAVPIYKDVASNYTGSPVVVDAHLDLTLIYQQQGNNAEALNSIKQAVALAPNNSDILFKEAQIYAALGKTEEAKKDATKAIELLQVEISKTFLNKEALQAKLGHAHLMLGHFTEASVEFEKALTRNPNMFDVRKGLALAQFHDKNFQSAIDSYDSLIKIVTADFNAAQDALEKDASSADKAKRVEELRKDIAYFHFQKGLSYEGLGDYETALRECRVGLEGVSTQEAAAAQKRILAALSTAPKTGSSPSGTSVPAEAPPSK